MLTIRTILHPTDFSDRSQHAFRMACSLAKDHGARLIALHVLPQAAVAYGEVITGLADATYREQMQESLKKLQTADPALKIETRMEQGDPATEIIEVARELKADLIVIGTHGRTGLGRLLLGSVAEQVFRKAPCAVLSLKMPFPEEKTK